MAMAPLLEITKLAAPLRQQAENAIRQAIVDGHFVPGQRITERELTISLGVSRTLVREALRQLESEGLISVIPNRGAVVSELSPGEIEDLYAIRAVLEGLAARSFAEKANAESLRRLGEAQAAAIAAYRANDAESALQAKNRFYEILVAGAGSASLSEMLATLHSRIKQWRAVGMTHPHRSPERSKEAIDGLKLIGSAIASRDAAAAEAATRDEARRGAAALLRLLSEAPGKVAARS